MRSSSQVTLYLLFIINLNKDIMRMTSKVITSTVLAALLFVGCKKENTKASSEETITIENMGRSVSFNKKN